MKKMLLLSAVLVSGFLSLAGCSKDPGQAAPATKEEIENDPATKEPGNV